MWIFADLSDLVVESVGDSSLSLVRKRLESFHIVAFCLESHVGQLFNEFNEFFVLGYEVCF